MNKFNINEPFNGSVNLEYIPCVNYAMSLNKVAFFKYLDVVNSSKSDWRDVKFSISGKYVKPSESFFSSIATGQSVRVENLSIIPDADALSCLTEGLESCFTLEVSVGGNVVASHEFPINIMAYDQWPGLSVMPELLAAFVTPNAKLISRVLVAASRFLGELTGSSSMSGYQTRDVNSALLQVAAIYEALRAEGIVYCNPPASFETKGQRVRMPDKVLSEKLGTCLDLTLLYASCIEACGMNPIVVMLDGHAFVGAWLIEDVYHQRFGDDPQFLLKSGADGVSEVVLVESTCITQNAVPFETAVTNAENMLRNSDCNKFLMFVDVARCRLENIRPLPQYTLNDGRLSIENDGVEHEKSASEIKERRRYDIIVEENDANVTRQQLWERKLLDFSLRNNLINVRLGKRAIPFVSFEVEHLEDCLQAGVEYKVLPMVEDAGIKPTDGGLYDSSLLKGKLSELIVAELKSGKLRSYLGDSELKDTLKFLYRTSRTALEENGANSLFVAFGVIKWYESDISMAPRFAPVLLLPVDIVRRPGPVGYILRARDEEIIINTTVVEFLKQQFKINITGLNPLPKDESGIDVKKIFAIIRTCIRDQKRWDLLEESLLGLFSFNKFVMWNDIHSNSKALREHPLVNSLINTRLSADIPLCQSDASVIDGTCSPLDFAIPIDVDSSQLEAVVESGKGNSFVLYGPPGTGKSQTITNMIANALYNGKRVLFVAEKMAALSVVQKRLEKIGLAPFCLELHSNKATKSHFIEQLKRAVDVARIMPQKDFQTKASALFEYRKRLIGYVEALHKKREFGISLFDCISGYLSCKCDEINVDIADFEGYTIEDYRSIVEKLEELDTVFRVSGHPSQSGLAGLEPLSVSSFGEIESLLRSYTHDLNDLCKLQNRLGDLLGIDFVHLPDSIELTRDLSSSLFEIPYLSNGVLKTVEDENLLSQMHEIISNGTKSKEIYDILLESYSKDVLDIDLLDLKEKWNSVQESWFLPKLFKKQALLKQLRIYRSTITEVDVPLLIDNIDIYKNCSKYVSDNRDLLASTFDTLAIAGRENWTDISLSLEKAKVLPKLLKALSERLGFSYSEVRDLFVNGALPWKDFRDSSDEILPECMRLCENILANISALRNLADLNLPIQNALTLERLNIWLANYGNIKNWYQWCDRKRDLLKLNVGNVVSIFETENETATNVSLSFIKGVYHALASSVINSDDTLGMFNGLIFEKQIEKYRQLSRDFQDLSKKELYCKLASRVPSQSMEAVAGSEMGVLKRNLANGGRATSIRRIIDQIPTLLPKLCPCMLMSPISVAQYIDFNAEKFDLVIFDEASQMPTNEAVGAIARSKALVVVGDPKQMPPTSFFNASQVDEDEVEFDDLDSILDDCIALSFPSRYLSWHYRSKHESLISFSNSQYYDGRLYTFPSVDDKVSKVRFEYVKGVYDKGKSRSNRIEAQAVVSEIVRRLQGADNRSIGVVAFSSVQQNLIEDLLQDVLSKNPALDEKANKCEEPIFIKNLENVQGDERDIILFSVGYGPDKNGYVSMNFGPLNNNGGERRLNVAVSRARYEMVVFSALRSDDIDLKRSDAKGVAGLKYFLEFAEKGTTPLLESQLTDDCHSAMVEDIAREISNLGYDVNTSVGRSAFKIDVAVVNPKDPSSYLLAILCDGKSYYEAKTVRDREIVRPDVLAMLNWNVMRIWSVDWLQNRDQVLKNVAVAISEAMNNVSEKQKMQQENAPLPSLFSIESEPVMQVVNERESQYEFCELQDMGENTVDRVISSRAFVVGQVEQLVRMEQPITSSLISKRIAKSWNIPRITPRFQLFIDSLLDGFIKDTLSDKPVVCWTDAERMESYSTYRVNSSRDIQDIPMREAMNAMLFVVEQQISIHAESLKLATARLLGFARRGANVDAAMDKCFDLLMQSGKIIQSSGMVSMNV